MSLRRAHENVPRPIEAVHSASRNIAFERYGNAERTGFPPAIRSAAEGTDFFTKSDGLHQNGNSLEANQPSGEYDHEAIVQFMPSPYAAALLIAGRPELLQVYARWTYRSLVRCWGNKLRRRFCSERLLPTTRLSPAKVGSGLVRRSSRRRNERQRMQEDGNLRPGESSADGFHEFGAVIDLDYIVAVAIDGT